MRVSHGVTAVFDDPNLVSSAGLVRFCGADCAGLNRLVAAHVTVPGSGGANAVGKVRSLIAGLVAVADCIDDMDVLRTAGCTGWCLARARRRRWAPFYGLHLRPCPSARCRRQPAARGIGRAFAIARPRVKLAAP